MKRYSPNHYNTLVEFEGQKTSLLVLSIIPILSMTPVYAQSGFIATSTNSTYSAISTDPNYNTYQNLALGFNIKYLKNMTQSQQDNKSMFGDTAHYIYFLSPHMGNFTRTPHLVRIFVLVAPSTGPFGIQQGLAEDVKSLLMTLANNSTIVISKSKGTMNSLPAYRIESETTTNPVNYTETTAKIPLHVISYVTVKDKILYVLSFATIDKNIQTNFIPTVNKLVDSFQYN